MLYNILNESFDGLAYLWLFFYFLRLFFAIYPLLIVIETVGQTKINDIETLDLVRLIFY